MARSAVKIEPVGNGAAVHTGLKSTTRTQTRYNTSILPPTQNPRALRSAVSEEVVVGGVADDEEWAPFERPDEISMAEVAKVKGQEHQIGHFPFALRGAARPSDHPRPRRLRPPKRRRG